VGRVETMKRQKFDTEKKRRMCTRKKLGKKETTDENVENFPDRKKYR
jgi:hypothetical protein